MKWRIGDRVLMNGRHPGTVVDCFTYQGRTTYSVLFDDACFALIPPQTAIGVREEELGAMDERLGELGSCRRPPLRG